MERQARDIVNLESELNDPTLDERRVKTIFSQMKSVLHLSENEIADLNCELSRMKQERDSLLNKLQNKDVQLAMYEQRAPVDKNNGKTSHRGTTLDKGENEDEAAIRVERDRIESERIRLKYALEAKEKELEQWKVNYTDIRSSRDKLQTKLGKKEEELAAIDKNYVSLQIQMERKENKIQVLESRLNERSSVAVQGGDHNHRGDDDKYMRDLMKILEDTAKDRERQVDRANDELKRAAADLTVLKEKHIVLEQEHKTTKTGLEQLRTKYQTATNEISQLQNEKSNLSIQLQTATTDLQNTKVTLHNAEESLVIAGKRSNELDETKTRLLQDFDTWKENEYKRFKGMENEHQIAIKELEKAATVNKDLVMQVQKSNCRNTDIAEALREKGEIVKNLDVELDKLRCQLENERSEKIAEKKKQEARREETAVELAQLNEKLTKAKKILKRKQLEYKQERETTTREIENLVNSKVEMKRLLNNYMHDLAEKNRVIQSKSESEASYEKRLSVLKVEIDKLTENWKDALAEKEEIQESSRLLKAENGKLNETLTATKSHLKETEMQLQSAEEIIRQGMKGRISDDANLNDYETRKNIEETCRLEKTVLEKEKIISDQVVKLQACDKDLSQLKSSNDEKDEMLRINSSKICALQNKIGEMEVKVMNEQALTKDLRACLEDKSKECELEGEKLLRLMETNDQIKQIEERTKNALEAKISENKSFMKELSDVQNQLSSTIKANDLMQSTKQTMEKEIEQLRNQLAAAQSTITFLKKCEADTAKRQDELIKGLLGEVAKKEDSIKDNGVLSTELADVKIQMSSLQEKLLASQTMLREKTKKIKRLKKLLSNEDKDGDVVQGKESGHKTGELQMTCKTEQMFDDLLQKHQCLLEANALLTTEKESAEKNEENLRALIRDTEKNTHDVSSELRELNEKYQQLLRDALALKTERDQLSDTIQTAEVNSKTALERVKELQGQLSQVENKMHEKVVQNESLSNDISTGQNAISSLQKSLEEKDLLITTYKKTNEELRKALETDKLQYEENVKRLDKAMSKHKEEALNLKGTLNKVIQNLNNYAGNINELTVANQEVASREQCLVEGQKGLKLRINELETINENNQQKICTLTEALKAAESSLERVKKEHQDVKTLLDVSEAEVKRMVTVYQSAESKITLLGTSYDASRQETVVLEQERAELKNEIDDYKRRFAEQRKKIKAFASRYKAKKADQKQHIATKGKGEGECQDAKQACYDRTTREEEQVIRASVLVLRKLKSLLEREGAAEFLQEQGLNTCIAQETNPKSISKTLSSQYLNIAEALSKVLQRSRGSHEQEDA